MSSGRRQRPYDSPRRREQAQATRRAIIDAAYRGFVDRGYAGASIEAIAAAANVSPESVYATFRNKRSLLAAVIDVAIAGDDAPVRIQDRDWVRRLREEPDRGRRLAMLAAGGREILERRTRIDEVASAAASADPEIAALVASNEAERLAGQRALLEMVAGPAGLRPGLTFDEAADVLFAIGSPSTFRLLVFVRGWSADRFEAWYAGAIDRLLLTP
jgi:AcrR family transcriptional regulator